MLLIWNQCICLYTYLLAFTLSFRTLTHKCVCVRKRLCRIAQTGAHNFANARCASGTESSE